MSSSIPVFQAPFSLFHQILQYLPQEAYFSCSSFRSRYFRSKSDSEKSQLQIPPTAALESSSFKSIAILLDARILFSVLLGPAKLSVVDTSLTLISRIGLWPILLPLEPDQACSLIGKERCRYSNLPRKTFASTKFWASHRFLKGWATAVACALNYSIISIWSRIHEVPWMLSFLLLKLIPQKEIVA